MKPLDRPDSFYVQAAEGWLELGNHLEANEELERVAPEHRAHPSVLRLRWHVYAKDKRWDACIDIAKALTTLAPDLEEGWANLGNSLYYSGRTQEAYETIKPMLGRFPRSPVLQYNLACYACQLGRLPEAKALLENAFASDRTNRLRLAAIDDRDLEPLWRELGNL